MEIIKQRLLALLILLAGLRLCLPVYQHLFNLLNDTDSQVLKTNREDERRRSRYSNILPENLAENAEVIFVSGYEAKNPGDRVKVRIDRPCRKVLLVLSSYEGIDWEVTASPHTKITGILVSSQYGSRVSTSSSTDVFPVELPYSYELANQKILWVLNRLHSWFGVDRLDEFRGSYSLPEQIEITRVDTSNPALSLSGYSLEHTATELPFELYDRNYQPIQSTLANLERANNRQILNNIIPQTEIAISPSDRQIYSLTERGIQVRDRATGKVEDFPLPANFPPLSWGMDLAYDSQRNIVSLVSLGGAGFFYRFDGEQQRWLDVVPLNNIDLKTITYDPARDGYIAWGEDFSGRGANLFFLSPTGELLSKQNMSDLLPEFYRLYDRGNQIPPTIDIVVRDNLLALIARDSDARFNNPITAIWHYDLNTQISQLTYKREGDFSQFSFYSD